MEQKIALTTAQQEHWRAKYGPWAVVTGASDGIGREIAVCLAKAGLNLVLVSRRATLLAELAASLTETYAVEVQTLAADLTQATEVQKVLTETAVLDVGLLVAAAGFGTSGSFLETPIEQEVEMLIVNCQTVLVMTHGFGQRLAKRGRGGIILISSLLAFQGVPFSANYAATKAYIQSLAEGLHVELALLGVDVLVSAPGPTHTGFGSRAAMNMTFGSTPQEVAKTTVSALGRKTMVRPSFISKLMGWSVGSLPRFLRVRFMGQAMKDMTANPPKTTAK